MYMVLFLPRHSLSLVIGSSYFIHDVSSAPTCTVLESIENLLSSPQASHSDAAEVFFEKAMVDVGYVNGCNEGDKMAISDIDEGKQMLEASSADGAQQWFLLSHFESDQHATFYD